MAFCEPIMLGMLDTRYGILDYLTGFHVIPFVPQFIQYRASGIQYPFF
jgi:hypothetical protein